MAANRSTPEAKHIYIYELGRIVDRQPATIRKWENDGKLPKHLLPKRGKKNHRYWTHGQVFGPRGIIAWMKKHDMRPGNQLTAPEKEKEHLINLRRPKYINGTEIIAIKEMALNGKSLDQIVKRVYKRTKYTTPEACEEAIKRLAKLDGFYLPKRPYRRKKTLLNPYKD